MKKQKGKKKEGPTKHAPSGALQCLQMLVWIGLGGVILPKARSKSVTTTAQRLKSHLYPIWAGEGTGRYKQGAAEAFGANLFQPGADCLALLAPCSLTNKD